MEHYAIVQLEVDIKSSEYIGLPDGTSVPVGMSVSFFRIFPENVEHFFSSLSYRIVSTKKSSEMILASCGGSKRPSRSMDLPANYQTQLALDTGKMKYGFPGFQGAKNYPLENKYILKSKSPFSMEFIFNGHTIVVQDFEKKFTAVCKRSGKELFVVIPTTFTDISTSALIRNLRIDKEEMEKIRMNPGYDNLSGPHVFVLKDANLLDFLLLIYSSKQPRYSKNSKGLNYEVIGSFIILGAFLIYFLFSQFL